MLQCQRRCDRLSNSTDLWGEAGPGGLHWDGGIFEIWESEVKLGFENCYAPTYSLIVKVHETKERNSGYFIADFLSQFQVSSSLRLSSFVSLSESLALLGAENVRRY